MGATIQELVAYATAHWAVIAGTGVFLAALISAAKDIPEALLKWREVRRDPTARSPAQPMPEPKAAPLPAAVDTPYLEGAGFRVATDEEQRRFGGKHVRRQVVAVVAILGVGLAIVGVVEDEAPLSLDTFIASHRARAPIPAPAPQPLPAPLPPEPRPGPQPTPRPPETPTHDEKIVEPPPPPATRQSPRIAPTPSRVDGPAPAASKPASANLMPPLTTGSLAVHQLDLDELAFATLRSFRNQEFGGYCERHLPERTAVDECVASLGTTWPREARWHRLGSPGANASQPDGLERVVYRVLGLGADETYLFRLAIFTRTDRKAPVRVTLCDQAYKACVDY